MDSKIYEEGGLATDGLDKDPVSGNDIPPGSNAEDVRDDVPAQLSSGEYVVPADVVKYFGVAYFEKLRAKAKAGLEGMEEDGRMGGEPVGEVSEGVSDEDLMKLDGYATGGMVMKDSEVNGIIDRVKAAAKSDPSVSNLLKSKGIYMKDDGVGPEVKGQAGPRKFNVGGTTDLNATGTTGDFNPYTYTPGFSVESGSTGSAPTVVGAPAIPAPVTPIATTPAAAPTPVTCPPGYYLDSTTNTCVKDNRGSKSNRPEHDPEAWMKKYDYTDPTVLMEQSLNTLNMGETEEEQSFLEKAAGAVSGFFDNGIFGKIFKTQKHAEVLANASVLESHGYTDQAAKLREAAGGYAESNKLKLGGFFDSTTTLTKMAMGQYGQTEMMKGNRMKSVSPEEITKNTSSIQKSTFVPTKVMKDEDAAMAQVSAKRAPTSGGSGSLVTGGNKTIDTASQTKSKEEAMAKAAGSTKKSDGSYDISSWYNKGGAVAKKGLGTRSTKKKTNNTKKK